MFIDHYSDLSYVFMQHDNTSAEIFKATLNNLPNNADKCRSVENEFINDIKVQRQTISYCGVNAHHQNRKAVKRIRDLQVKGGTMLIHPINH